MAGVVIRGLVPLGALIGAGASTLALAQGDVCGRDLFMAEAALRQTADRLERAGEALPERCRVWRQHVQTLRQVAGTYDRCLDPRARAEKAGSLKTMAGEFDGMIKGRCR